jgi:hypothetical protein
MSEQNTTDIKAKPVEQVRKRIPLGSRNILTAPQKVGFVRRFVNDTGDRIQMFKDAGWNAVDDGSPVGDAKIGRPSNIGSAANPHVGGGQRAVLMEIPEEIYEADRAESQAKISAVENQIKRNSRSEGKDGLSGSVTIS